VHFLFTSAGIEAGDIRHAAVTVGPGSFTGLRIGISFIKGLFLNRNTRLIPVSSLHCMAYSYTQYRQSVSIIPAMDARQGNVFWARFIKDQSGLQRISGDVLSTRADLHNQCSARDILLADTLGYKKSVVFTAPDFQSPVCCVETAPLQRGLACALLAAETKTDSPLWKNSLDIFPEYLQPSYSELKPVRQII
jgi:tRNA threonylcarbamoyl adenosine modification protein YeaZ